MSEDNRVKVMTTFKDGRKEYNEVLLNKLFDWQLDKSVEELELIESIDVYM